MILMPQTLVPFQAHGGEAEAASAAAEPQDSALLVGRETPGHSMGGTQASIAEPKELARRLLGVAAQAGTKEISLRSHAREDGTTPSRSGARKHAKHAGGRVHGARQSAGMADGASIRAQQSRGSARDDRQRRLELGQGLRQGGTAAKTLALSSSAGSSAGARDGAQDSAGRGKARSSRRADRRPRNAAAVTDKIDDALDFAGTAGWPDSSGSSSSVPARKTSKTGNEAVLRPRDSMQARFGLESGSAAGMRGGGHPSSRLALDAQALSQAEELGSLSQPRRSKDAPLRQARMDEQLEQEGGWAGGAEPSSRGGGLDLWADDLPVVGQSNPDR